MMGPRKIIKIASWPGSRWRRSRLEDLGFFYDADQRTWIKFCDEPEVRPISDWLKQQGVSQEILPSQVGKERVEEASAALGRTGEAERGRAGDLRVVRGRRYAVPDVGGGG